MYSRVYCVYMRHIESIKHIFQQNAQLFVDLQHKNGVFFDF